MKCIDCNAYGCYECGKCECPEWIKSEFRLPNQFDYILITDGKLVTPCYFQDEQFLCNESGIKDPTHWMHFPQPPKEK